MKKFIAGMVIILCSLGAEVRADIPAQLAGVYVGTVSMTTFTNGGKSKQKATMLVNINPDSTTEVTIAGVPQIAMGEGGALYSGISGIFLFGVPATEDQYGVAICSANFKKGKLTGSFTGYLLTNGEEPEDPPILEYTIEGKFKLKK